MMMESYAYKDTQGETRYKPIIYSNVDTNIDGCWCLGCGEQSKSGAPQVCVVCGLPLVFGIEALLIAGMVKLK